MFFFLHGHEEPDGMPDDIIAFLAREGMNWTEMEAMLDYFRRKGLTLGALQAFLFVSRRSAGITGHDGGPITVSDVAKGLMLSYPTTAKYCDVLSTGHAGRPGLNWLLKEEGADRRERTVRVSSEGKAALAGLVEHIARQSSFYR